jgi:hypothetical protein
MFDGPASYAVISPGLTASGLTPPPPEYFSSCTYVLFITINIMSWWRYVKGQMAEKSDDALTHILGFDILLTFDIDLLSTFCHKI